MLAWPLEFPAWTWRTWAAERPTPNSHRPRLIRQGMPRIPEGTPTRNHATPTMPQLRAGKLGSTVRVCWDWGMEIPKPTILMMNFGITSNTALFVLDIIPRPFISWKTPLHQTGSRILNLCFHRKQLEGVPWLSKSMGKSPEQAIIQGLPSTWLPPKKKHTKKLLFTVQLIWYCWWKTSQTTTWDV